LVHRYGFGFPLFWLAQAALAAMVARDGKQRPLRALWKPHKSASSMSRHLGGGIRLKVTGVVFSGSQKYGDFNWMIAQDQYQDALFIFNDNEEHYKAPREDPMSSYGCTAGGGNAIIRPYQCKAKQRSAGIPTGPNYTSLTPQVQHVIDEAVAKIRAIAIEEGYDQICYNADSDGNLGTNIFAPGEDV
jgi:hypothetical protein